MNVTTESCRRATETSRREVRANALRKAGIPTSLSLGPGFICAHVHDIGKDVKDTMKLTAKDKTRYLYEYAFYDVVRDYNESQVTESRPDYIMASEGRMFRTRLGQRLASEGKSMETLRIPDFIAATNAVLSERMGRAPYAEGDAGRREFNRQFGEYKSLVGLETGKESEVKGEGHYMPISPYDPRFAMNVRTD